ncbi:hypothetical protein IFM89_036315 [Coptis chinensis]|uniref:F-box associated beta-propeller type 3 domain-containing protein n=1 Tax=Coptis chinensis TaxID=261450 RepID=A0A835M881_9MAGN|nr:hypothetical protein IFM89_036315 [Coptis chinensis]
MRATSMILPSTKGVKPDDLLLISSCNGLLLFKNTYSPNHLSIYNSVTAQFEALPLCKYFDVQWGLAHDSIINKYKVFGICNEGKCLVLTRGGTQWVEVDIPFILSNEKHPVLSRLLLAKKELHWLTTDYDYNNFDQVDEIVYHVFSINVETMEFQATKLPAYIECPDYVKDQPHYLCLSEIEGWIGLTILTDDELVMLVLTDREDHCWLRLHGISLKSLLKGKPRTFLKSFLSDNTCLVAGRGGDKSNL